MSEPTLIKLENGRRNYGYRTIFNQLNVSFAYGRLAGLCGPNGCGKTTLMHCLLGIKRLNEGQLQFFSQEGQLLNEEQFRSKVSYLGHQTGFFSQLSGRENLDYLYRLYRPEDLPASRRESIDIWLEKTGLYSRAEDEVQHYSRGMQQRLMIARLFSTRPEFVFLDEPLAGLDAGNRRLFMQLLGDYRQQGGGGLVVSHYPELFAGLWDDVLLNDGSIWQFQPAGNYMQKLKEGDQQ